MLDYQSGLAFRAIEGRRISDRFSATSHLRCRLRRHLEGLPERTGAP
jgi:hypothetical protein